MESTERSTFYDEHPFDWISADAAADIHSVVSRPLVNMIDELDPDLLVVDVGCGSGRVLGFFAQRGLRCIGIDRSRVSGGLAAERYSRPGVVADNVRLPFVDGAADVVISDGVIHHTDDPFASFSENCRILKPGGRMYLAVYKPTGRYPWLYKYPGSVIRIGLEHAWTRPFVLLFAQAPYFLFHVMHSGRKRTWTNALNLFYDYFVTPRVVFLSRELVEQWCHMQGASVTRYEQNPGSNVHSFCLVKEARVAAEDNSDLRPGMMLAQHRGIE
jgi:SAM-dependent methyltransferase